MLAFGAATHALVILAVPLFQLPDSVWYVQIAADVAEDLRFDNPLILQRPLGYPLFLASIFALFGQSSAIAIQVTQHLMALAVGFLAMMIVTELSRSRALMVIAGLGTVTSFQLIGYANTVLTETCYTLVLWIGIYSIIRFHVRGGLRWMVLASLSAGAACSIKPTGAILLGVCAVAILFELRRARSVGSPILGLFGKVSAAAVLPWASTIGGLIAINGFAQGEFRLMRRSGAVLYTRTMDSDRLTSDRNEPLARIMSAMDEWDARRPAGPGAPVPLKRTSHIHAERACEEILGMGDAEIDELLHAAAMGLIREHWQTVLANTITYMMRSPLLPDGAYRHVPGGAVADGWHCPADAELIGVDAYHQSTARLAQGGILDRYLPPDPGAPGTRPATGLWSEIARAKFRAIDSAPSITGLTDSRYEDYALLCAAGCLVSLLGPRRSGWFLLALVLGLHLLATGLHSARARYVVPMIPMLKIHASVFVVGIAAAVRWAWPRITRQTIPHNAIPTEPRP